MSGTTGWQADGANGSAEPDPADRLRGALLDLTDLRFENERLRRALSRAQDDAIARAEESMAARRELTRMQASRTWRIVRRVLRLLALARGSAAPRG